MTFIYTLHLYIHYPSC